MSATMVEGMKSTLANVNSQSHMGQSCNFGCRVLAMIRPDRLQAALERRDMSQSSLARAAGISANMVNKLINGRAKSSSHIYEIATALDVSPAYLSGEVEDFGETGVTRIIAPVDHDLVELPELDLAFGMGATFMDMPVTAQRAQFSRRWLQNFTTTSPDKLYFARGAGDSMMPTILDCDILLIDTSETTMRVADQIWALSYCGLGMIKRLRYTKDAGVRIMSDNPHVREDVAYDGELHLLGRVVAIVRKI
ncbi:helix-turn-helix domain-containing protein [Novosphingobium sp. FSY-8]|uniref:Helix-turn-helix domain-containing protein n=1 Tax=Novosphingobium ovatum TaxID=1908523 RepID=A0ABW9XAH1_9SPHN|nr:S24 family peptidase [Novosphingobium ovatum]NBC35528.1 helix-turn-helix domain-containing protein [Novosphingobium ovatum]